MGVGKGVKVGDVKESAASRKLSGKTLGNRRRPKKWYSKTLHAEVMRLSEIFTKEYGHRGVMVITENVKGIKKGGRLASLVISLGLGRFSALPTYLEVHRCQVFLVSTLCPTGSE